MSLFEMIKEPLYGAYLGALWGLVLSVLTITTAELVKTVFSFPWFRMLKSLSPIQTILIVGILVFTALGALIGAIVGPP